MALRKIINISGKVTIQTSMGTIEDGEKTLALLTYIKVESINGTKNEVNALVSFTADDKSFFNQYQVPVSVSSDALNFIAQVYEHLKTLPELAGAENC
jgi:hypothetical protein